MTQNKAYADSDRRKHDRISYNLSQRPFLKIQDHELEVTDISEGGLRIISNPDVMIFDKSSICGTIILLGGDSIDFEADSTWDKGDENGLKFRNLIPSATIQKERDKFFRILIEQINSLPGDWHLAGSVYRQALNRIVDYALEMGPVENSVETGSGRTTLLFSHLSKNHVVFAIDSGKSISSVKKSDLFNANNVSYIEGPTQKTLPQYVFNQKFDIVLMDGPHAYPFPDLEYYYFYQNLTQGGLFLLDDIQIPSIQRMFEIIRADDMFELLEVLDNKMAFFRRTDSQLFNPYLDNWWLQGYNRHHYEKITGIALRRNPAYKILERTLPEAIKKYIPNSLKSWIRRIY